MSASTPATLHDEAAMWAALRDAAPLTPAQEAAFSAWLNADPAHARALQDVDLSLLSLAEAAASPEILAMRAAALQRARSQARARWSTHFGLRRALAVAAVLLICFMGVGAAYILTPRTYTTGIGERRVVALEDGSRISLDAATEVRVRYLPGERRLWLAEGRAKFDVAHNPLRPFSVTAAGRTVVATGTSFSVELINTEFRVVLYEGSVAVLSEAAPQAEGQRLPQLRPGEELVADTRAPISTSTEAVDAVRARAWEGGQLVFDDEALAIAVSRVNRYARHPVVLSEDMPSDLRVSGVFNANDTEAFVDGVVTLLPLERTNTGTAILLQPDESVEDARAPSVGFAN